MKVAGSRVDDHASRLVNYNYIAVFVENIKWDIFGECFNGFCFREGYLKGLISPDFLAPLYGSTRRG